jgi:leucyl aminopeptidase
MKAVASTFQKRPKSDLLVVPCWKGKRVPGFAASVGNLAKRLSQPMALGDFEGKRGETAVIYLDGGHEARALLIGLGDEKSVSLAVLRESFGAVVKRARGLRIDKLSLLLPKVAAGRTGLGPVDVARGAMDGLLLANYAFTKLKGTTPKSDLPHQIKSVAVIGATKTEMAQVKEAISVDLGVTLTRDLINGNADDVTPQTLGSLARSLSRRHSSVTTHVFDRKRIEKEKMGLLLAVSRGSARDPAFLVVHYKGKPSSKDHTVIIGKGVTYDTGGLNLKPTGSMETMKTDMSGAAAVLGTIEAAAQLGLKINVTAVVAATENGIDGKSYKPGDVYTAYSGKTVEIHNTDAEGRLTLADALAYSAKKLKPSRMINLATLTGAVVIALGEEVGGLMSNDDKLSDALSASGSRTGEELWRLPLVSSYGRILKSEMADIRNCGSRAGSSITAGLFLQEFVGKTPWAHLDIAGVAYTDKPTGPHTQRATGFGVRLLVDLLKSLKK